MPRSVIHGKFDEVRQPAGWRMALRIAPRRPSAAANPARAVSSAVNRAARRLSAGSSTSAAAPSE